MTVLIDSSIQTAVSEIDLTKYGKHDLVNIYGESNFYISAIHIELLQLGNPPGGWSGISPVFNIQTSSGIILVNACQVMLTEHNLGRVEVVEPYNPIIFSGDSLELHVSQPTVCPWKMRVTVIGNFEEKMGNKMFISGSREHTLELEKMTSRLEEIASHIDIQGKALYKLGERVDNQGTTLCNIEQNTNPSIRVEDIGPISNVENPCGEVTMNETDKDLDNSLWKELPEEVREAAEKAGIGLEDLHEMAREYVAIKEAGTQQRRWLEFLREDNYQSQRPIILAKIEAEKELKLAKIKSDAEVAKAKASSATAVAQARSDQYTSVADRMSETMTSLFGWAATGAALSYIAYCVCGIFI